MEPIFVLVEYDPWQMVIGSDSPTFALYDNGFVIFSKEGNQRQYYSVSLQGQTRDDLIHGLIPENLTTFKNYYELSHWTDQPTTLFYFKHFQMKVYGDIRNPDDEELIDGFLDDMDEDDSDLLKDLPDEILNTFNTAISFDHHEALEWVPEMLEVMVWPYENAPDPSIKWPEHWPDLDDDKTVKRGKESYSVFLPSKFHLDLIDFLNTRKPKGAVKINHKKMIVTFRFPFPSEVKWME